MTPPELRIGTSGYSYPGPPPKGWAGVFYPVQRGRRVDPLEYYSRFFDAVEINSTFYGPPAKAMGDAWVNKTPDDFCFTVKLWQKFTHPKKIGQGNSRGEWEPLTEDDIALFKTGIRPIAESGKLGALLLQYPAGLTCSPENMDKLARTCRWFADYPKVVELRHRSWTDRNEETKKFLLEIGATWALIDEPKFASSIRQNFEPVGHLLYFRAHGRNAEKWWQHEESWERYDYCYSPDEIRTLAEKIKAAAARPGLQKALVFFNNHARANAAANALMLKREVGMPLTSRPSETLLKSFPQLSTIVPPPRQGNLLS